MAEGAGKRQAGPFRYLRTSTFSMCSAPARQIAAWQYGCVRQIM